MTVEAPSPLAISVPFARTGLRTRTDHREHTSRSDSVYASRRRTILAISLQTVLAVFAVSVLWSFTSTSAVGWLILWCLIDIAFGGTQSVGHSVNPARTPLLVALIVTGAVASIAAFTSMAGIPPALSITEDDRPAFLLGLWGTAATTAVIRSLIPRLLPKRRLRIVSEAGRRSDRAVSEAVFDESARADRGTFVAAVLTEVRMRDIELVELTFPVDAETLRSLSWALRSRDVQLYLPIVDLGLDPTRVRTMSATDRSGLLIAPSRPSLLARTAKRIFDTLASSLLIVFFFPLILVVAISIKISMPGPVFFTQTRIGLDGKPFEIIKFRSMVVDADAQLGQLLESQGTADQPLFKIGSDPRITRLGHLLRRSSVDELPQLFNVFGGTMSLVGPRPQRDGEVALYRGTDHHRLGVRPGMTGLWQVSGRSNLGWDQAREFDLYYAHNWSLKNDLKILLRTFGAVVRAAGAQ